MEAEFTRTGGIAGPAGEVRGLVTISDGTGTVSAPGGDYRRPLLPEEVAIFDPSALAALADAAPALEAPHSAADLYQFDFHANSESGGPVRLGWRGAGGARHLESGPVAALMDWVERECDRIWRERAQALAGKRP